MRFGKQLICLLLTVIALSCIGVSLYLAYQAGCAGDLKTGAGEPLRALELENLSTKWAIAGLICGGLAILLSSHESWLVKVFGVVMWATIGAGVLWFIAVQLEFSGVRACL